MFTPVRSAVIVAMGLVAQANAAIFVDFNSGYVNGNLNGQVDPGTGVAWSGTATNGIIVTGGKAQGSFGSATQTAILTLPGVGVAAGGDNKIEASFDLTGVAGGAGNTYKLAFRDTSSVEFGRFQVNAVGGNGRLSGGGGVVTTGQSVAVGSTMRVWALIDVVADTITWSYDIGGGRTLFGPTNPISSAAATGTSIKQIYIETFSVNQSGALLDNIYIAPEPASLAVFGLAGIVAMRRRRRVAA